MIKETYINQYISNLDVTDNKNTFLEQKDYLAYLSSDTFSTLNQEEKKILFFCTEVIHNSFELAYEKAPDFDIDRFIEFEEKNWQLREEVGNWQDTLNQFFEISKEEDALAFLEDITVDDDESDEELSLIGKEMIFITVKSYLDTITTSEN